VLHRYADKAVGRPSEFKVPDAPKDGMQTRRFKIPPDFLTSMAGDIPAEVREAPRRPTALDVLKNQGIPFPDGATAIYIPAAAALIVRNTEANLALVEAYMADVMRRTPLSIHATLFIAQAGSEAIRGMVAETADSPDHASALAKLEKLAAEDGAQFPVVLRFETRSGQRATIESGVMHAYAEDLRAEGAAKIDNDASKKRRCRHDTGDGRRENPAPDRWHDNGSGSRHPA
jgi:hypothetical protein